MGKKKDMENIKDILKKVLEKQLSIGEAEKLLKANLVRNVGDLAQLDIFRTVRTGVPEVIYAYNKEQKILMEIIENFLDKNNF